MASHPDLAHETLPLALLGPSGIVRDRIQAALGKSLQLCTEDSALVQSHTAELALPPVVLLMESWPSCPGARQHFLNEVHAPVIQLRDQLAPSSLGVSYPQDALLQRDPEFPLFVGLVAADWVRSEDLHRFVRDALHELRTSLATAQGFAHLLQEEVAGPLTPTQGEYTQFVCDATDQMSSGLETMYDSFRLRLGAWPAQAEMLCLADLISTQNPRLAQPDKCEGVWIQGSEGQLVRALALVMQRAQSHRSDPAPALLLTEHEDHSDLFISVATPPSQEERTTLRDGALTDATNGTRSVERVCGLGLGLARELFARAEVELEWVGSDEHPMLRLRCPKIDPPQGTDQGNSKGISKSWRRYKQRPSSPSQM